MVDSTRWCDIALSDSTVSEIDLEVAMLSWRPNKIDMKLHTQRFWPNTSSTMGRECEPKTIGLIKNMCQKNQLP